MLSPNGSTEVLTGRMQAVTDRKFPVSTLIVLTIARVINVLAFFYFGPFVISEAYEFGQAIREFQILKGVI